MLRIFYFAVVPESFSFFSRELCCIWNAPKEPFTWIYNRILWPTRLFWIHNWTMHVCFCLGHPATSNQKPTVGKSQTKRFTTILNAHVVYVWLVIVHINLKPFEIILNDFGKANADWRTQTTKRLKTVQLWIFIFYDIIRLFCGFWCVYHLFLLSFAWHLIHFITAFQVQRLLTAYYY